MFELTNNSERFVRLRCSECGNTLFLDSNQFKTVTSDYVIVKDKVSITCDKCGASQPQNERYIPLEPQIIHAYSPKDDLLSIEELESALIWD